MYAFTYFRAAARLRRVTAAREAWQRKYAREPAPWRGPVHAAPLLAHLRGVVVELGAGGGKVGAALPPDALALDWAALPPGRPGAWADVRALPLRAASVDALVAIHVLGHLLEADRARALAEWARVLRPGGRLLLEVFDAGDARAGSGALVEPGTWAREGIATHYFSRAEVEALRAAWSGALDLEERAQRWGTRRAWRGVLVRPGG